MFPRKGGFLGYEKSILVFTIFASLEVWCSRTQERGSVFRVCLRLSLVKGGLSFENLPLLQNQMR
jgi:hypothetical protein